MRIRLSGRWPAQLRGLAAVRLMLSPSDVADGECFVELAYGEGETALVTAARAAGCTVIDGREALVLQGAASFERWTGVPAPVSAMRAAVEA